MNWNVAVWRRYIQSLPTHIYLVFLLSGCLLGCILGIAAGLVSIELIDARVIEFWVRPNAPCIPYGSSIGLILLPTCAASGAIAIVSITIAACLPRYDGLVILGLAILALGLVEWHVVNNVVNFFYWDLDRRTAEVGILFIDGSMSITVGIFLISTVMTFLAKMILASYPLGPTGRSQTHGP